MNMPTTPQSNTPRSDAKELELEKLSHQEASIACQTAAMTKRYTRMMNYARTLELELQQSQAECAEMRQYIESRTHAPWCKQSITRSKIGPCDCGRDKALSTTSGQSILEELEQLRVGYDNVVNEARKQSKELAELRKDKECD